VPVRRTGRHDIKALPAAIVPAAAAATMRLLAAQIRG
jgi:hypothetical protein